MQLLCANMAQQEILPEPRRATKRTVEDTTVVN